MGIQLNPPDGWNVTIGTWTVDMADDTATYRTGATAIIMVTNGGEMKSEFLPIDKDRVYEIKCAVRADSIAGGNTVTVGVEWYTAALAYISTSYAVNAILGAASTWEEYQNSVTPPGTAFFAKLIIKKPVGNAFSAWFDRVVLTPHNPYSGSYFSGGATALAATTWTTITPSLSDLQGITHAAGVFTVLHPGRYIVGFTCRFDNLTGAGEYVATRVNRNNGGEFKYLEQQYGNATGAVDPALSGVATFDCAMNDTLRFQCYTSDTGVTYGSADREVHWYIMRAQAW